MRTSYYVLLELCSLETTCTVWLMFACIIISVAAGVVIAPLPLSPSTSTEFSK